jgi:hypothetical protein
VAGIGTLLGSFAASNAPITEFKFTPEQRQRNRRVMLELVRSFWVKGVLEPSLHGAAMIELGLESRQARLPPRWRLIRACRQARAGTDLRDFKSFGKSRCRWEPL